MAEPDRGLVLPPGRQVPQGRGSFGSVRELVQHIDRFIASYNDTARPFVWTKTAVHQKRLKPCIALY
jgi:hypothetical protein